jgi:serine/threonine-protein kinase HipA
MQRSLQVFIEGRLVGTLAEPRTNKFTFAYDAGATDVVSARLPFSSDRYPPASVAPLVDSLAPPEPKRLELAERFDIPEHQLFRFLELCGDDLPGAITFRPLDTGTADGVPTTAMALTPDDLTDELAVVAVGDGWALPAAGAPSSHMLRLEDELLPGAAAAEFFALTVARRAGIATVDAQLTSIFDIPAIVVARPDRTTNDSGDVVRRHLEHFGSLCGVALEGDDDRIYEEKGGPGFAEIATALDAYASDPQAAIRELVHHMVLHFCTGNTNAHANTYSLLEPERTLGPVHTLLPAEIYTELVTDEGTFDIDHRLAMSIGGCQVSTEVTRGALIAEAASWPRLARTSAELTVDQAVERLGTALPIASAEVPESPARLNELIEERLARLRIGS